MTRAKFFKTGLVASAFAGLICLCSQPAYGQPLGAVVSPHAPKNAAEAAAQETAIMAYWTPERMAAAKPYPMPAVSYVAPSQFSSAAASVPPGPPAAQPGYNPDDPTSSPNAARITFPALEADTRARNAAILAAAGNAAPASVGYPSAHTTQELQAAYLAWPRRMIGKLFFTQNSTNYVCSASLIGRRHVVTAGHCIHDGVGGASGWSTNIAFSPSYDSSQGGVNPAVGYWVTNAATVNQYWYYYHYYDADLGVAAYGNVGSLIGNYPGSYLGWFGYTINWGIGSHVMMWGYPVYDRAATANNVYTHFQGGKIFLTAAEEAGYTMDWGAGFPDSKFIGTTQTPGMDGGPWIVQFGKIDYSSNGGNWMTGVNSTLRCYDCSINDWAKEVSSPQFTETGDANGLNCVSYCGVVDTIVFAKYYWP